MRVRPTQDLVALLGRRVRDRPVATALAVVAGPTLSFADWERRSNALARGLGLRGVRPGDRVVLLFDNARWVDYAVAYLGTRKAGAVAVPLGKGFGRPERELARVVRHCGAMAIVSPLRIGRVDVPASVLHPLELEDGQDGGPLTSILDHGLIADVLYAPTSMAVPRRVKWGCGDHPFDGALLSAAEGKAPQPTSLLHAFAVGTPPGQEALCLPLLLPNATARVMAAYDPDECLAVASRQGITHVGLPAATARAMPPADARHDLSAVTQVIIVGDRRRGAVASMADSFPDAIVTDLGPGWARDLGTSAPGVPLAPTLQVGTVWREQVNPGSGSIPPIVHRLGGPLDTVALEAALTEIFRRHEVVRSNLDVVDGRAALVVGDPGDVRLPLTDVAEAAEADREAEARRVITEWAALPFDLVQGPTTRASLVRLGPEDHLLVLQMHHGVWDDWSFAVFHRELTLLYAAFRAGLASPLPDLRAQFGDLSRRHHRSLDGPRGAQLRSFWARQLEGAPFSTQLPVDDPSLPEGSPVPAADPVELELPAGLVDQLRSLGRDSRATLFMTMLAAFGVLLHRFTGQDDVVPATFAADRSSIEHEALIGCFIQGVPLRLSVAGDPTFTELLARVREVVLDALAHQDLPDHIPLQEMVGPRAAALGLAPASTVTFQSWNAPQEDLVLDGLTRGDFEHRHPDVDTAGAPSTRTDADPTRRRTEATPPWGQGLYLRTMLVLSVRESDTVTCVAGGAFHPPAVERLLGHYQTLLADVAAHPERPISALRLLREATEGQAGRAEDDQPEHGGRRPQPDFGARSGGRVEELFEAQVERAPDRPAVVHGDRHLTFAELDAQANRLARVLRRHGAGPHAPVGVLVAPSVDLVVAVLAIWKAGAAYVGLDPLDTPEHRASVVDQAGTGTIVATEGFGHDLAARHEGLCLIDPRGPDVSAQPAGRLDPAQSPSVVACVFHGSGPSTIGRGAHIGHASAVNLWAGLRADIRAADGRGDLQPQRSTCPSTPTDDAFLRQILALLDGHILLVLSEPVAGLPQELLSWLRQGDVDMVDVAVEDLAALVDGGLQDALGDRPALAVPPVIVVSCRDAIGQPSWRLLRGLEGADIHVLYGPAECSFGATSCRVAAAASRVTVGRPMYNMSVSVVDGAGRPVPLGVVGELAVAGPSLARGGEPGQGDGWPTGAAGWATGQLARQLPGGNVQLVGRIGERVDLGGFPIHPGWIEAALADCPSVSDVAVIRRDGPAGEKHLVAYVIPGDSGTPTLGQLRHQLWTRLPGYTWPDAVVTVASLPVRADGRVDDDALPLPPPPGQHALSAVSPVARLLTGLWAEVLGVDGRDVDESCWQSFSFLEALDLACRSGVEVEPHLLRTNRTVATLSAAIGAMRAPGSPDGKDYVIEANRRAGEHRCRLADQLSAIPSDLRLQRLPARSRASRPVPTDARFSFTISPDLRRRLETMACQGRATMAEVLLTAFAVVVHRYGNPRTVTLAVAVDDAAPGDDAATLPAPAPEPEPVAVCVDVSGEPTFAGLLARLCTSARRSSGPRRLSLSGLAQHLGIDADVLSQVVVSYRSSGRAQDLRVEAPAVPELMLRLDDDSSSIAARFDFSTEVFEPGTIERMAGHLCSILEAAAASPDAEVSTLPLLSPSERRQLLVAWNATEARGDGAAATMVDLFEAQVGRAPDAVAVEHEGRRLSYAELDARSNQLAHLLQAMGVAADVAVGISVERSLEMAVGLLGILKAGGACLPLDPSYPAERLHFLLEDAAPPVLLTQERLAGRFPRYEAEVLCLDRDWARAGAQPADRPSRAITPDDLAYLIYTSGSTGMPKGVLLPHRGLANHNAAAARLFALRGDDRVLQFSSLSFDISVEEMFCAWTAGAAVVLRPEDVAILGRPWLDWLRARRITVLDLPTAYWHEWVRDLSALRQPIPETVRTVVVGGETALAPAYRRWLELGGDRVRWINTYGPTEASVVATAYDASGCEAPADGTELPIGRPLENTTVYVLDHRREPVPVGVPGELYIGGVGVARGYLNRPELTAERFVADPFSGRPGARLYRTGDLALYRPDGNLQFGGRVDDQVKVRGFRVEPGEIEVALAAHPGVDQAVVVAREDTRGQTRLVAYVVPSTGAGAAEDEGDAAARRVAEWQQFYDQSQQEQPSEDPALITAGWVNSYTGDLIPADEMGEWAEATVARILSLEPRRVMEIGCGTGLLLWRIAPHCEHFIGTDISGATLDRLGDRLRRHGLDNVSLEQREGADFPRLQPGQVDTIVVNSVVQAFPSLEYLERVLDRAVEALAGGGTIFVGDVRSLPVLKPFYASVALARAGEATTTAELRQRVERQLAKEVELIVDPAFFTAWAERVADVAHVEILLKRAHHHNELNCFRYDAVVHVGTPTPPTTVPRWVDWGTEGMTLPALRRLLIDGGSSGIGVTTIPNARVAADVALVALLDGADPPADSAGVKAALQAAAAGVDPEELWSLGEELGFAVSCSWAAGGPGATFDAAFVPGDPGRRIQVRFPAADRPASRAGLSTNPLAGRSATTPRPSLVRELREALTSSLPAYMVPAAFVVLAALPLTTRGKVDRRALPAPGLTGNDRGDAFVAPSGATEEALVAIWEGVLGEEGIGVEDDFFELGGDSLLGTQVIARVREALEVELPLRVLFEALTVRALAQAVEHQRQGSFSLAPPLEPRAPGEDLVLSSAQERLWFLDQLVDDNAFYNVPTSYRLLGPLDVEALERSLNEIMSRHEALRTTFLADDPAPRPLIMPPEAVTLRLTDLGHLGPAEAEAEARRLAGAEAMVPFDLARGPLLRARLLRVRPDQHVFVVTLHHIASDGWSLKVLLGELRSLYRAFSHGDPSPLSPLPIQYADYAVWERRCQAGPAMQTHLEHWRALLADRPPASELPADHPRPATPSYRGASHRFTIPAGVAAALKQLASDHGATLFMTLLAGFEVLLSRYAASDDIVVGTGVAGRTHPDLDGMIGFFVNTVVLRTDLSGDPTFDEVVERVRETTLEAYAHQELPFERLVADLAPTRDLSRNPLLQIVFQVPPVEEATVDLSDEVSVTDLGGFTGGEYGEADGGATSRFDLEVFVSPSPDGGLAASLVYATDLFEADTIARLAGHFTTVLEAVAADPSRRLSEVPLLSEAERRQLRAAGDDISPSGDDPATLTELFEAQAAASPETVALAVGARSLTYGELNTRANRLAHHLRAIGVGPEVIVGICVERGVEMVVGLLGIMKAGGAYLPLDPAYPADRLAFMVDDAGVPVLLTQHHLADRLPEAAGPQVVVLDDDAEAAAQWPGTNLRSGAGGRSLAYIIYTSGSTGRPKGVMVEHANVVALLRGFEAVAPAGPRLVGTALCPFGFDVSVWELFSVLCFGGELHLLASEIAADAAALVDHLARHGVTSAYLPPSVLDPVASELEGHQVAPQLDRVLVGVEPIPQGTLQRFRDLSAGLRVINGYGPTETTVCATFFSFLSAAEPARRTPIGSAVRGYDVHVVDSRLQPVPRGVVGEVLVGGAGVARGYLADPDATASAFVAHPLSSRPGARVYRTGDLARMLPDGALEYVGRADTQVKVRGFRIELGEIEAALLTHPDVAGAVAVVREDTPGDRRIVAYVVPRGRAPAGGELRRHLADRLPVHMLPAAVVELEELPLTRHGKVDRRALPPPGTARPEQAAGFVAPRTPTEVVVAEIWADVLGLERVGAGDDFFDLGGHSLLATQVVARLRGRLGIDVPLRTVFSARTVAEMAIAIAREPGPRSETPVLAPAPRGKELVLSFAQERLWFLDQLAPDNPFYNVPAPLRISGPLNVDALERALSEIVARHEILRTGLPTLGGRPVQVVSPPAPVDLALPLTDLSPLGEAGADAEARRQAAEDATRPFDLAEAPLFRVRLLRLAPTHHVLLLTMHHIVFDGWSAVVLLKELCSLYRAFSRGGPSPLAPLAVQYADYASWQRRWLMGEVLEDQLGYWRTKLVGSPPALELPADHPRPPLPSHRGATHRFEIPAELGQALKALGGAHGATMFMTLLAAFNAVASRYTGGDDIVVGTPIAGRTIAEVEDLIGLFVNTLVLRTDLSGDPSFDELVERLRDTALEAYAHQDLPFEQLVTEMAPVRDLSRNPLVQVLFHVLPPADPALDLLDHGTHLVDLGGEDYGEGHGGVTSRLDLEIFLTETEKGGLAGTVVYATDLFEAPTIARLVEHFTTVLEAVAADPGRRLSELSLLSATERRQLLVEWSGTGGVVADAGTTLTRLFEAQVAASPESVALTFDDQSLTYGQLNDRANRLAHELQDIGVGPDVIVGICADRGMEMVVGLLGILKAGGAYLPLDPDYPAERLAFMVQDAGAPVLLTQQHLVDRVPDAVRHRVVYLDTGSGQASTPPPGNPDRGAMARNLAYVIYTSGSTGTPKGVMVEHANVVRLFATSDAWFGFDDSDVWTLFHSYAFDFSVWELWGALLHGGRLVIVDHLVSRSPKAFLQLLAAEGVTVLNQTPSAFRQLVLADESSATPVSLALRLVVFGGEALDAASVRRWFARRGEERPRLVNMYGITETTVHVTACWLDEDALAQASPIGRPLPDLQVYVLDGDRQLVPIGVGGELYVGGAGLARGYLNRPELTDERFVPSPFDPAPGARLYKTGDSGRWRHDGTLEYLGRLDHQVKIRGFRVELGEIEAALVARPGVRAALVVSREDSPGDQRLVAYLTTDGHRAPSWADLRRDLLVTLPAYMVPATMVVLDEFPLTPSGKVDLRALPVPETARPDLTDAFVGPRTPAEEALAEVWAEVLRIERVGIHDDFFDLGGHSLLATQVVSRVRERLDVELPLRLMFDSPTVAGLAAAMTWPSP